MTVENRRRLTRLIAAGTKLDAAARLAREAVIELAHFPGILPREPVTQIAAEIDAFRARITTAIEMTP